MVGFPDSWSLNRISLSNVVIVWLSIKAFAFSDVELFFGWMIKTNKKGLGDIETQPHTTHMHCWQQEDESAKTFWLFYWLKVVWGKKFGTNTYYFCCCWCVLETVKSPAEEVSRTTFPIYQKINYPFNSPFRRTLFSVITKLFQNSAECCLKL